MALNDDVPSGTWRWLGCAAVTLLIIAIGGISLISAGTFDPNINGTLQKRVDLSSHEVPAQSDTLQWLDLATPNEDYSLRMQARLSDGEADMGYGLAVGGSERYVLVAVSPLGYLTVRDHREADSSGSGQMLSDSSILPWQTWPHVRSGEQVNEIWINVNGGAISNIRINGELLQTADLPLEGKRVALWAESYGDSASVEFLELELFYQEAP